jgi:hypothetical protein
VIVTAAASALALVLTLVLGPVAPASAAVAPSITVENAGWIYDDEGPYRPVVRVDGVGADDEGSVNFESRPQGCTSPVVGDPMTTVEITGSGPAVGPDFSRGRLGMFWFGVRYRNRTAGGSTSICTWGQVKTRTSVTAQRSPASPRRGQSVVVTARVANATADTAGSIIATAWPGTRCGSGDPYQERADATASATLTFRGLPVGSFALQVRFTGDGENAPSETACQTFRVSAATPTAGGPTTGAPPGQPGESTGSGGTGGSTGQPGGGTTAPPPGSSPGPGTSTAPPVGPLDEVAGRPTPDAAAPSGGDATTIVAGLLVAAVLVSGGIGLFAWRRRKSQTP